MPRLRGMRALALIRPVGLDDLVQDALVDRAVKHGIGQLEVRRARLARCRICFRLHALSLRLPSGDQSLRRSE